MIMIVDLFLGISFETMSNYFWDKPNAINKPIHQSQMDAILHHTLRKSMADMVDGISGW